MSDEFNIHKPGISRFSVKKLTKNLQISARKLRKILNFISEKGRIIAKYDGSTVTLNCPKLKELTDEYTQKQVKNLSGQTPDGGRDKLHPKEAEGEGKEEKDNPPPPSYYMERENQEFIKTAKEIVDYHNLKFDKNIGYGAYGNKTIFDRLVEGYVKEQFIKIIDTKSQDPFFQNKPTLYKPSVLFSLKYIDENLDENPDDYEKPKKEDIPLSANVGRGIITHEDLVNEGKRNND